MEEQKTVLLSLEFDTEEALKRAGDLRVKLDEDKSALARLNKEIYLNGEATAENRLEREKLEKSIRETTRARGDELRAVDNYIKASKRNTGSIKEVRAEVAFLTEKYTGLSKAERENVDIGGKLQAHIRSLNDDLKKQEGAYGDNRRSVGGYLDAIRQAPGAMGKMKAGISGISTALSASPLGLLTTILPAIIGFFNSSGEGADFFAKAMGGVNAVLQVGMKYLVKFAGYLVDAGEKAVTAFSSPKKLLTDLVEYMKTNLINRFKAFAVILEGIQTLDFRKVTDGVIQMGTGVTDATTKIQKFGQAASKGIQQFGNDVANAANAGAALEDQLDKLAERERAFALASAETERQIEKLLIQARNRQTSEADRIKLLDKAEKLELRRNQQELAMARQRVELVKKQNQINQEDADVQDERLKESQKRVIELERQSENIREKIQVRRDALSDAALERQKKRSEAAAKLAAETAAKELERLEEIEKQRQIALEQTKLFLDELAALEKKAADEKAERDAFLLSVDIANAKIRTETAKKEAADKIALKEKEYQVLVGFTNAASNLAAALAEENSALADFQKAVTLFQIGLASAEAITKGIAASQDLPFPANLVAMGTTIATITANLLQAKQLIDGGGAPKYKAAEGGILVGPSHAQGGITGTGRFANVEVEGEEAIINKRSTAMFAPILSAINMAGGGKPLAPTNYAALGGFIPTGATGGNAGQLFDYDKLANKMINAIERMPAPVVGISDIKAASARKDQRTKRVTLGA